MKVTAGKSELPLPNPALLIKPINSRKQFSRRKSRVPGNGVRLRKDSAVNRSSRPETPLLKWRINEGGEDIGLTKDEKEDASSPEEGRKTCRKVNEVVSSRKLAAAIWRMQLPEVPNAGDRLKIQLIILSLRYRFIVIWDRRCAVLIQKIGFIALVLFLEPEETLVSLGASPMIDSSFQQLNYDMEGATKWDPLESKVSNETNQFREKQKVVTDREERASSRISVLESELEQANTKIHELETEKHSSKKKLDHFLKKLDQERASWRKKEHEKVRAIIDDMKIDLHRERKTCQKLENVNSKLMNELSEAKLTAKRYIQEFHKERKSRELIEEVCDELVKEIAEDKAEVEALNRESMNFREDIEEEKKMLQIAEVWREERVQMKLIDAKLVLEDQYSYMNNLISNLESFLSSSRNQDSDGFKTAVLLHQAASSVNIHDLNEFKYEPSSSDDIFSIMEEVNFGIQNEKQIEQCVEKISPKISIVKKDIRGHEAEPYVDRGGPGEDQGSSEWETVSHGEDHGSSSVDETDDHGSTSVTEVCSVPSRKSKKVSSISRLWKSRPSNGENCKIISVDGINGRHSNGSLLVSSECGSSKGGDGGGGGFSPDLGVEWSSPEMGNPHITKGMKGCIEWPRGIPKGNLKSKLLEARIESQKIQLRHVLKQKI